MWPNQIKILKAVEKTYNASNGRRHLLKLWHWNGMAPIIWLIHWNFQLLYVNGTHGLSCSSCWKEESPMVPHPHPKQQSETIERMTCHCFLRPIRRDLKSSSYTTVLLSYPRAADVKERYPKVWYMCRAILFFMKPIDVCVAIFFLVACIETRSMYYDIL